MIHFRKAAWLALLTGAAISADVAPAMAAGALALSQSGRGGWAYGLVVGRPSTEAARLDAMRLCLGHRQGANCRVVHVFSNTCMSLAFRDGGNGFGWATRPNRGASASAALSSCLQKNPGCTLKATNCD